MRCCSAGPGALDRIGEAFAAVVDAKSPFTADHSRRVTEWVVKVSEVLGLGAAERTELRRAALLHDLGKLSVPNSVLDKPGPLAAEEWKRCACIPTTRSGSSSACAASSLWPTSPPPITSASMAAGTSAACGARRCRSAPASSRLADVYDALTSARPYRPAMTQERAIATLEKDRGIGVAEDCLDALLRVVGDEGAQRRDAASRGIPLAGQAARTAARAHHYRRGDRGGGINAGSPRPGSPSVTSPSVRSSRAAGSPSAASVPGGASLGLLAMGGLALGMVALGGLGVGVVAVGGGAIAWYAAIGGLAIARDYAIGGLAMARNVIGPSVPGRWPLSSIPHPPFRWSDAGILIMILTGLLVVAVSVQQRRKRVMAGAVCEACRPSHERRPRVSATRGSRKSTSPLLQPSIRLRPREGCRAG